MVTPVRMIALALAWPGIAFAQTAGGPPAVVAAETSRTTTPPVVDGNVLDDPSWSAARIISGFWQTTPDEGQPASENTEVRVLYTEDMLYIGVVNYDRSPDLIISADSRRDAS